MNTFHSLILENVSNHIKLDKEEEQYFSSLLIQKNINRKSFLLKAGDICHEVAFVNQGCLCAFNTDGNGFEHILQFAPEDWWITDMLSFISQNPAHLSIQAIENSEVLLLSKVKLNQLYQHIPKFERLFRILTENSLIAHQQRILDAMTKSAEEKYQLLCMKYPTLFGRLSQKQIASYIGVTPEFLSKMLKRKIKKS